VEHSPRLRLEGRTASLDHLVGEREQIVDDARRRVTSFFSNIIDLHDTGLVPQRVEKLLTDFAGFDLLYSVVEPLERALMAMGYRRCAPERAPPMTIVP
jgi:hypothetical protein